MQTGLGLLLGPGPRPAGSEGARSRLLSPGARNTALPLLHNLANPPLGFAFSDPERLPGQALCWVIVLQKRTRHNVTLGDLVMQTPRPLGVERRTAAAHRGGPPFRVLTQAHLTSKRKLLAATPSQPRQRAECRTRGPDRVPQGAEAGRTQCNGEAEGGRGQVGGRAS